MNNNKQQQLYYSTNENLQTVYKIRQERKEKLSSIRKEWDEIDGIVAENWQRLYNNALLLEGQTRHLGFSLMVVEEDYYAPQRVWIYFHTPEKLIEIEFHQQQWLKKINDAKINDTRRILNFSNEMNFVKRAIAILLS